MTFNLDMRTETYDLLEEYKTLTKWYQFSQRNRVKKRIYEIELPNIKNQLSSIPDIENILIKKEYSRIYANTVSYLFSNKKFNSKKFDATINPKSKKNLSARSNILRLYIYLTDECISFGKIDKLLKRMKAGEISTFEHITKVRLNVFTKIIQLDKILF